VLLLSTTIYGDSPTGVVGGLVRLMRRVGVVPLPAGGTTLVQPIHVADVAASLYASLFRPEPVGHQIIIAGKAAIQYREFVGNIAAAYGLKPVLVPIPEPVARAAARALIGPLAPIARSIRRRMEDQAFDTAPMDALLGISPRPFTLTTGSQNQSTVPPAENFDAN
jgi:uncharacterized protein YbjT (DUF2867 family)